MSAVKGRILYVEDDPDVAGVIRLFFESEGYEVTIAPTGEEALDLCRSKLPDVILLDIMMPGVDGYEVCRRLRSNARTSHVPILFVTALDERSDRIAGLELGADDYITKPFDIEELRLRVQNVIKRARRENVISSTTGLPSGKLIEERLLALMRHRDWAVLYTGINHIDAFNQEYGFVAGDDVLRFVAMILNDGVEKHGTLNDFIGHVRADEFIVTTDADRVDAIQDYVVRRFKDEVGAFYPFHDRNRGYMVVAERAPQEGADRGRLDAESGFGRPKPVARGRSEGGRPRSERRVPLMTLAIGVVTAQAALFQSVQEIAQAAAEARRMARSKE
jgi:PleD family two-component response regulator